MSAAVESGERLVQPAPRLQEVQWLWRRLWSFAVTLIGLAVLAGIVWLLGQPGLSATQAHALQAMGYVVAGLIAFVGLIYVGGATTYEIWQLVSAVRIDRAILGPVSGRGR